MIALSFDIEEFDLPAEHNIIISAEEQIAVSAYGLTRVLDLLERQNIKATFFSTVVFAKGAPELIQRIVDQGHELASHGCQHSGFNVSDLKESKRALEEQSGLPIHGFRMPRMMPIDEAELHNASYEYNSSLNPTCIPGRYNHLMRPRSIFKDKGVWQIPASVSYPLRIPLFWISLHQFPLSIYKHLCNTAIRKDGYLNVYFHPWEFYNQLDRPELGVPGLIQKNSGDKLVSRLEQVICYYKNKNIPFTTLSILLKDYLKK